MYINCPKFSFSANSLTFSSPALFCTSVCTRLPAPSSTTVQTEREITQNEMNNTTGKRLLKFEEEEKEDEIENLFWGIMEGYEDSAIPSLEKISPLKSNYPDCSRKRERGEVAVVNDSTMHKERTRRENMAEKYSILQSLIPSLASINKVSRAEIVNEATSYIKKLEEEKKKLEDQKRFILQKQRVGNPAGLLSQCMNSKPSVNVCVCNGIAVFGIQLLVKRGLLIKIFYVFEKYEAEVLGATINGYGLLTFTCKFKVGSQEIGVVIENIKKDILSL